MELLWTDTELFMVYSTLRSTPLLLEITALRDVHHTKKYTTGSLEAVTLFLEITTL